MPTIDELRKEIEKEKAIIDYERNEYDDYEEKVKLQKQLNDLRFQRKYGKSVKKFKEVGKPVLSSIKNLGNKVYSGLESMKKEQMERERREKAINKRGLAPRGLFG